MAIEKEITNDVGISSNYHRISRIDIDYDKNQLHVYLKDYADESYRNLEKTEIAEIETQIARYYELSAIAAETRTDEESAELYSLSIQELEAMKIKQTYMKVTHLTITPSDDFREAIYERLMQEIPAYADSTSI